MPKNPPKKSTEAKRGNPVQWRARGAMPPKGKFNAVGYAQRQQRKAQGKDGSADIYEYSHTGVKRSNISLSLTRDETQDMKLGEDSDSDDPADEARIAQIRTNMDEEGIVRSEDDEEIESDDAFDGGSDEERFANFKFKDVAKSKKPSRKSGLPSTSLVNLDEDEGPDEDEDQSDDSDPDDDRSHELVDLSQLLDEPANGLMSEGSEGGSDQDDAVSEDSESDEDGALVASDEDNGLVNDNALDLLSHFVGGLENKKRKHIEEAESLAPRKRRVLPDRTEAGPEGELVAPVSSEKLRLEDMLAPLLTSGTGTSSLIALKKSTKALAAAGKTSLPLPAPLPTRVQDRLDREAAYEQTKAEAQKWDPTMKRIRQAEHLSFPLQPSIVEPSSTAQLASKFKPSNEMESAVDRLLKTAKLREEDVVKTEDLKMQELTPDEVKARRAELRRARELLFRAEAKANRIAKIKSKTYRRIHRKQKEKNAVGLDDLEKLDPELADAERMKLETDRARERASLRHKNGGKWLKKTKEIDGDLDRRQDIAEMLERGEMLKQKIMGSHNSEDEDDLDEDVAAIKQRAFDELAQLDQEMDNSTPLPGKSGVLSMKFMQSAEAKRISSANALANDLRRELGDVIEEEDDGVNGTNGRFIFQPSGFAAAKSSAPPHILPRTVAYTASETSTIKSSDPGTLPSPKSLEVNIPRLPSQELQTHNDTHLPNPWLPSPVGESSTSKISRKSNEVVLNKDSSQATKSKNALKKQQKKTDAARAQEREDATVEISLDQVLTLPKTTKASDATNGKGKEKAVVVDLAYQDEGDSAEEEEISQKDNKKLAIQQRDLVALAFAGDNVVQEFEETKRKEVEADAPREEDNTLPGWGSWTGPGMRKRATNPKFVKKIPGVDPTKRADFGKSHIIISERRDKKAAKFMVKDLPFPYTSARQYERSLEVPLGAEWNTRVGFQKGTLPRVVKKLGTVINPLERLF